MQKPNRDNLLAYAFQNTISEEVLACLPVGVKILIPSEAHEIPNIVQSILNTNPTYILGLGEYSGKDRDMLKIETRCTNKFKNSFYGSTFQELPLSNFLTSGNHTHFGKSIGNSYCNLISYLLMKNINDMHLQTHYSFVHIPKTFDIEEAVVEISAMLL